MSISTLDILTRLVVAAILPILVGLERDFRHRPAGLRTNAIIGLATALMTMESITSAGPIAAMIVGVALIAGATIIQARGLVKGLTAATTLFLIAGIGIAVGMGMYEGAVIATIVVLVIQIALRNMTAEEEEVKTEEF